MAYKPPQVRNFSTTYTPKYMAGDFKFKKISAPDQPIGLSISAYRISKYVNRLVSMNDLRGYKHIFEQIKILVKSVMHVLCERRFIIDFALWGEVNAIPIPPEIEDTVITFPVQRYDYEQWVDIFRALIPTNPYPFNADNVDNPLNNSTSIDLLSRSSSMASEFSDYSSEESSESTEEIPYEYERHEEWYETAIYAYQNLLLTSNSKRRELIDLEFQDASKSRNRSDRNKAHDARTKAINGLKKNIYDWVNRIGHIVKSFNYMRLKSLPPAALVDFMRYADLMLVNGVLNNTFMYSRLIEPEYEYLTDPYKKYPQEAYIEAVTYYHNKQCVTLNKLKERMLYDTIASIIFVYYKHHYSRKDNGLLHELDLQTVILDYFNGITPMQEKQIRTLINRLTDASYNDVLMELKTFNATVVETVLAGYVCSEPQQQCIIRLMAEFDFTDTIIEKMRLHPAKRFESYHNTVAWGILFNVVPFSVTLDEWIFTPANALDIYISLLNHADINPVLIKNNRDSINDAIERLIKDASSFVIFRLKEASKIASKAVLNI